MKILAALLATTLLLSILLIFQNTESKEDINSIMVIAHRGDHTGSPENSLSAINAAIQVKADFVEIDLRTTKDSQLVILHDANLMRMTGLNRELADLTLDEIRTLKISQPGHPEWGLFPIPHFSEVLANCKGKIRIYLDFKNASAAQTYRDLKNAGMENQVIVYINTFQQFEQWRQVAPALPLMISLPEHIRSSRQLEQFIDKYKPEYLDGRYDDYSTDLIEMARKKNVKVWPDIQSPEESKSWEKAIKMGFSGLQTDHPADLIRYLEARKLH